VNEGIVCNCIDAKTGHYVSSPASEEEFVRRIRDLPLGPAQLRQVQWWIERYGIDDPNRAPAQDIDPLKISSAGWGVIFAPGINSEIKGALKPLLDHREKAAGSYFKRYDFQANQTKEEFLASQGAGPGPADPRKMPYYLLIVGSPEEIPFRFQYELDVQYAVGRIHFENVEDYTAYANNVLEAETAAAKAGDALPPKQVVLFGVRTPGDTATERSTDELIKPLGKMLTTDRAGWPLRLLTGPQATKEQLSRLLGGRETPSVLLTASHGLSFPFQDPLQRPCQGALLCQDWPGVGQEVLPQHYFSGNDLPREANLRGLVVFHFACYSGGTPAVSSFADSSLSVPQPVAPSPFISGLAQRLLSHPQGALAIVGHVDRAWTTSFSWSETGQIQLFENTFKRLLDGHPLGSAMEFFNQRHAELSVAYTELAQDRDAMLDVDAGQFARVYRGNNDARNFVVLGDPAVKATYRTAS
jgi:hypothetical protein